MAKNEEVRRFLRLLGEDPDAQDNATKRELAELSAHPEVVGLFGARAAWALALADPPAPAPVPPNPQPRRRRPVDRTSDPAVLLAAAVLTAGYWTAVAATPDAPNFDRQDYMDTLDAMIQDLKGDTDGERQGTDGPPRRALEISDEGGAGDAAGAPGGGEDPHL